MSVKKSTDFEKTGGVASPLKRFVMWLVFHFFDPCILMCYGWKCCKTDRGWMWFDPKNGIYLNQTSAIEVCEGRIATKNCKKGKHSFETFRKRSERSIYFCRTCAVCGCEEVKAGGPFGAGEWRNVNDKWKFAWEESDYKTAVRLDT